jgi:hypothetical protein
LAGSQRVDMPEPRLGVERTGVVVIRIWLEDSGARNGLRARISLVRDLESGETESVVAASTEEILEAVRRFVDEFAMTG